MHAPRLNRYNLPKVNTIHFLFSTHHSTPFLYGKIDFGVLRVKDQERGQEIRWDWVRD